MSALHALREDMPNEQRIELICDSKVAEIISAPGHQRLRHPEAVREMSEQLRNGNWEWFGEEALLLNIFPELGVIDCVDGNHRLAAVLLSECGQTVGDLPARAVEVWLRGQRAGERGIMARWIPMEVAKGSTIPIGREVPAAEGAKGPTAEISADIPSIDPRIAKRYRGIPLRDLLSRNLDA